MRQKLFLPLVILLLVFASFSLSHVFESRQISPKQQKTQTTPSLNSQATDPDQTQPDERNSEQTYLVTKVIDGDTIEIESGSRVRYIGVDTPETVDPTRPTGCFGFEASNKNKELVSGKRVRLEKDVSETDRYGRMLRYVYVNDLFVNEHLVKEGFAKASSYPPDVKFQEKFREAENFARTNNKGLWGSCGSSAGVSTSQNYQVSDFSQNQGCLIKGNISSSGEKIYHLPQQRYYNQTVIDESKNEKWFCSEDEAQNAGWRKSKL